LLFDDDKIGDFVKSIQIDSPYQQMLLEGVLTESVKDEKLFVSFTVEGYFHYVLGEVIYTKTKGHNAEVLKQLVDEHKLNGAKEGIEQCLIRDVNEQLFQRLFQLIDFGGEICKYSSVPIAHGLLQANNKSNGLAQVDITFNIQWFIDALLENPTQNDFNVLLDAIIYLEQSQKNDCLLNLFNILFTLDYFSNIDFLKIVIKGLPYIEQELKLEILNKIELEANKFENHQDYPEIIFEIGTKLVLSAKYEKAIELIEKSKYIYETKSGDFDVKIEKIFSNLGAAYWYIGDIEKTQYYFELSFEKCLHIFGYDNKNTSGSLQNLALVYVLKEQYDESIIIFNKSLDISLKQEGYNHPNTARIYSNLGSAYFRLGKLELANELFQEVLKIDKKVLHEFHPSLALDYDDIGDILFEQGDINGARESFEKSKLIFVKNYGIDYPHVKILDDKINKLSSIKI
jgi:tetratricopeptide (TPR) repeat protein